MGSISLWLEEVKDGNDDAARQLWTRYFPMLVAIARRRLGGIPCRLEDEEDIALSALNCFCRAADAGRLPDLNDRHGLWRLLCRITHQKTVDVIRRATARGGDAVVWNLHNPVDNSDLPIVAVLAEDAPAADVAEMMADEMRRLLQMLPHDELRAIAIAKMDGYTNLEIADKLGCAMRTVERRLSYIRTIWRNACEVND
jgi:DNA-directed RNA polymerase specialized sigma24 family protein